MGIVVIAVAIIFARVKLPEITQEESTTHTPTSGKLGKAVLFGFLALLAYEVAEISINSYFVICGSLSPTLACAVHIYGWQIFGRMGNEVRAPHKGAVLLRCG